MGLEQSKKKALTQLEYNKIYNVKSRPPPGPIRIGLIGDEKVGKTSICKSFTNIEFQEEYIFTVGNDKFEKIHVLENGNKIKLIIWDTAGQERFRSMVLRSLRNFGGIILVFDVTSRDSFNNLGLWLLSIQEECKINQIIILFGNKVDEDKEKWAVNEEEIERFAKKNNLHYFDVSAKNGMGINEGISYLTNKVYDYLIKAADKKPFLF